MIKFTTTQSTAQILNLNNTRLFSQAPRESAAYSVSARTSSKNDPNSVKQVAVVLYNLAGNEVSRTYFAVSPLSITG